MPRLTVRREKEIFELEFEGTPHLDAVLARAGLLAQRPCGGRGACGKCAVRLSGRVSEPNAAERRVGARLACQAILLGDAQAELGADGSMEQIEFASCAAVGCANPMSGRLGAAVDLGTTTIALQLYDLSTGRCIGAAGARNPQVSVAADVMGRIGAAMDGRLEEMRLQALGAMDELLHAACVQAGRAAEEVDVMVVVGNTTMLYLLTGRDPATLSCAPFAADFLFDEEVEILKRKTYLPPCMSAFVGADVACGVLASGLCDGSKPALLCDIGTNGELALWKDGVLRVCSTAAGPAFEGAGISCGCSGIRGAIDHVWAQDGRVQVSVIGGGSACGLCGSGLIDAIAVLLDRGEIDESGAARAERMLLRDEVFLTRGDVRAVQLAKAAIAAGIQTLLEAGETPVEIIEALYIAGGFGRHLDVDSAARIGLIPAPLKSRAKLLGNAALRGAAQLLLNRDEAARVHALAACAQTVNLGGNPCFNAYYVDQMFFPDKAWM